MDLSVTQHLLEKGLDGVEDSEPCLMSERMLLPVLRASPILMMTKSGP